jgi:hypothetical protein
MTPTIGFRHLADDFFLGGGSIYEEVFPAF